jgi:DNA-binding MarR family transcriptional regulator
MESCSANIYSMESSLGGTDLTALFSELVRLEVELWDAVEGRVRADHGMALGSYEVMTVVARQPGCRVHDIATALSITVGGVSKIVDRLEAAGYCARRANPADRRSSIIELTAPGARLLAQLSHTVENELERRLGPAWPGVSLAGLTRTLTQLRSTVRATGTPDATDAPNATAATERAAR